MSAYRTALRETNSVEDLKRALEREWLKVDEAADLLHVLNRRLEEHQRLLTELEKRFRNLLQRYEIAKGWPREIALKRGHVCFNLVMAQAKKRVGLSHVETKA